MLKSYRGPEPPKEKLYQKEAAGLLGLSQPAISIALRTGKLKSLKPEDVAAYKDSRHYRQQYYKRKEEREDRMHEEHMTELRKLTDSIRLVGGAQAAATAAVAAAVVGVVKK